MAELSEYFRMFAELKASDQLQKRKEAEDAAKAKEPVSADGDEVKASEPVDASAAKPVTELEREVGDLERQGLAAARLEVAPPTEDLAKVSVEETSSSTDVL